ncbi:MAG: AraC family transcriptional regulator [Sporomusa sp.]|jgi:AraC family transcriptional regulator of adaptative response / methylphosphotriester-DNA alkyltransferase methyltransferase|nr:AraC family transcriptional regulator [Sporomusa sp.]
MENPVISADDDKWQAVISCDESSDGLFFYGVKTTGVFCRPSCRSRTPLRENVVFFNASDQAVMAGFRPCKKCRPDMVVFEPDLELVRKAIEIFDQNYNQQLYVNVISQQLGVSAAHLAKLCKQHIGLTPAQYVLKLRVEKAVKLIEQTNNTIIEIAHMTGFRSLSNFYKFFKEQVGHTPNKYRRTAR